MGTRKVNYTKRSIEKLPDDKPVVYKILTDTGNNNYTGTAKRGRVRERIAEHLNEIPGSTVVIEQFSRINEAEKKESNIIKRSQPKYNKAGK